MDINKQQSYESKDQSSGSTIYRFDFQGRLSDAFFEVIDQLRRHIFDGLPGRLRNRVSLPLHANWLAIVSAL